MIVNVYEKICWAKLSRAETILFIDWFNFYDSLALLCNIMQTVGTDQFYHVEKHMEYLWIILPSSWVVLVTVLFDLACFLLCLFHIFMVMKSSEELIYSSSILADANRKLALLGEVWNETLIPGGDIDDYFVLSWDSSAGLGYTRFGWCLALLWIKATATDSSGVPQFYKGAFGAIYICLV